MFPNIKYFFFTVITAVFIISFSCKDKDRTIDSNPSSTSSSLSAASSADSSMSALSSSVASSAGSSLSSSSDSSSLTSTSSVVSSSSVSSTSTSSAAPSVTLGVYTESTMDNTWVGTVLQSYANASNAEVTTDASEGTTSVYVNLPGDGDGFQIAAASSDRQAYSNGYLNFSIKSSSATDFVTVRIKGTGFDAFVDLGSYVTLDGTWQNVNIPLADFSGADLTVVSIPFVLGVHGGAGSFSGNIDNVYWSY